MIEDVTSYVTICLQYLSLNANKFQDSEFQKIVNCLMLDFESVNIERQEIDLISNYIHKLYFQQSSFLRTIALDIIFEFQSVSQVLLIEKYNFDLLVAMSIGQKRIESEKVSAYKIVLLLLRKYKYLPSTITRALISAYDSKEDSKLILIYLKEASIVDENIFNIPEVGSILMENLYGESSNDICNIICYAFEKNLPFITNSFLLNKLVLELFTEDKSKKSKQENTYKSIVCILQKWSGFIGFGLKIELIQNLIKCISHETTAIVSIFRSLIRIKDGQVSISDSYSGFVLYTLLQFDFIRQLLPFSSIPLIASFLHFLSSLTTECNVIELPRKVYFSTPQIVQTKISQPIYLPPSKHFIFNNHELQWSISSLDWELIYTILSFVIPLNEEFGQSQSSLQMYNVLFEFFSDQYLQEKSHQLTIMNKCLFTLLNLLLNYSWGKDIIESSTFFKYTLDKVVKTILEDKFIEENSQIWVLFDCIAMLMCSKDGISILTKYNIIDDLLQMGTKCNCISNCKHLLSSMKFIPKPGWTIPVYSKFLYSRNVEISNLSIIELWEKSKENNETTLCIFQMLLVPYIKSLYEDNEKEKLQITLNIFYKFLLSDERVIKEIATDDIIHNLLSEYSHFIYSIVFSIKESLNYQYVINEIKWWMNEGNLEYLNVYDASMKYSFCHEQKYISKYSSVIDNDELPLIPPHLFQFLSKTDEGIELIKESITSLISSIRQNISITKIRSIFFALSHFSSSPKAEKLVELYEIPKILIEIGLSSTSYLLKGTLIECLSLFYISDYFSSVLQKYNWRLFQFEQHSVIVPCDIFSLINTISNKKTIHKNKKEIPKDKKEICDLFIQLINPIISKNAKEKILNIIQDTPQNIICYDVALYVHNIIGDYSYPPSLRMFIYEIFKKVSLEKETSIQFKSNKKTEAIFKAQCYELLNKNISSEIPLSQIQIPQYSPSEIHYKNINIEVPEIYVKDNMFQSICSVCKSEFYLLSDEKQNQIRKNLLL